MNGRHIQKPVYLRLCRNIERKNTRKLNRSNKHLIFFKFLLSLFLMLAVTLKAASFKDMTFCAGVTKYFSIYAVKYLGVTHCQPVVTIGKQLMTPLRVLQPIDSQII